MAVSVFPGYMIISRRLLALAPVFSILAATKARAQTIRVMLFEARISDDKAPPACVAAKVEEVADGFGY